MSKRSISLQKDIESNNKVIVKNSGNPLFIFLAVAYVLSISIGIVSFRLYVNSQKKIKALESQTSSSAPTPDKKETDKILSKVEKHLVLPPGTPQIITVSNVETLKKGQPFFNNVKDGNQLLIYQNKVIIYDPVADKIVDIAYIKPAETINPPLPPNQLLLQNPRLQQQNPNNSLSHLRLRPLIRIV